MGRGNWTVALSTDGVKRAPQIVRCRRSSPKARGGPATVTATARSETIRRDTEEQAFDGSLLQDVDRLAAFDRPPRSLGGSTHPPSAVTCLHDLARRRSQDRCANQNDNQPLAQCERFHNQTIGRRSYRLRLVGE